MYHMPKPLTPNQEQLLTTLQVDCEHGKVYRNGRELGYADLRGTGYFKICLGGRYVKRANIVWWAARGEWPKQMLDHRNRNKLDDSISNLEPTTNSANAINSSGGRKSKYGLPKGVTYNPTACGGKNKPYVATLIRKGKKKHVGRFPTKEEAIKAYQEALDEYNKQIQANAGR